MLTLLTLLISIFVDASTSIDTFQTYVNHSCAFDYKRVSVTSQSECKEKCFEDTKCLTCTYSNNNCYLSSTDQHTLFDTSSTISRKIDRSQCGSTTTCIGSQECSRMDSVTATCTDGFGCGCSCTVNADCQQNQMDVSKLLWEQTIYQRFESSGFWSLRWCNRRKSEKIIKWKWWRC